METQVLVAGHQPSPCNQGMGRDQAIERITGPRQSRCTMSDGRPGISSDNQPEICMQRPDNFIRANTDALDFMQESQFEFDHRRNGELLLFDELLGSR